jgi:molybdopterin/thiamine biosynthesis adenylyltransferase
VAVGDMPRQKSGWVVYPTGWSAGLERPGTTLPSNLASGGAEFNPVGAAVAAALGAAAVYHHFNQTILPRYEHQAPLWISTLHRATAGISDLNGVIAPPLPSNIDLGRVLVVGAGALGGNALAILGRLNGLRGRIDVVDQDRLDLSNLNRLPTALIAHVGLNKAELALSPFTGSAVETFAHTQQYERLWTGDGARLPSESYDLVLSGVDQMASRAFIQAGWPRLLIDGGTAGFSWRVSSFPIGSAGGCAGCLAGNSQANYNQLRAPLACGGGGIAAAQTRRHFESYGFVSFLCAAFMAGAVLQRALGSVPGTGGSTSVEADALHLSSLQRKDVLKSALCLCRCGEPVVSDYRNTKYAQDKVVLDGTA